LLAANSWVDFMSLIAHCGSLPKYPFADAKFIMQFDRVAILLAVLVGGFVGGYLLALAWNFSMVLLRRYMHLPADTDDKTK